MKFATIASLLAVAASAKCYPSAPKDQASLPTTTIAGIEVVDTQLVRDARELIKSFIPLQPYLYNHLMRSWLYGAAVFNNNATLKGMVDLEMHAIGTLLHDLGWDMRPDSPWHSLNKPFEVDSAIGAVEWVKQKNATGWDETRLEQMHDGIVLQGVAVYLNGKNINSNWIVQSIEFEFPGPRSPLIPNEDYDSIQAEFNNQTVFRGTNETFTWLALTKPQGVHNTFIDQFGVAYVPGYGPLTDGTLAFNLITAGVADEIAMYPNATWNSNL